MLQLQLLLLGQQQLQQQLHLRVEERIVAPVVRPDERFKIQDRFTVIPTGAGEFRLHSLTYSLALRDNSQELLARLLPLLDGERTVAELVAVLAPFDEASVHAALDHLKERGALESSDADTSGLLSPAEVRRLRPQIAFLSHFVPPTSAPGVGAVEGMPRSGLEYQERIAQAHVSVFGVGRIGSRLVRDLIVAGVGRLSVVDSESVGTSELASDALFTADQVGTNRAEAARALAAGYPAVEFHAARHPVGSAACRDLAASSDFAVLCPDHFDPGEYSAFNRDALASKTSWTSARLAGFEFQIGPTVIPFETPCFACFDLRQKSNLADLAEYQVVEDFLRQDRLRAEMLALTPGAGLLALEVLKAITWFMPPASYAHLYSLNLLSMESKRHPVLKIPRCPACGREAQPRPTIHAWQQSTVDPSA